MRRKNKIARKILITLPFFGLMMILWSLLAGTAPKASAADSMQSHVTVHVSSVISLTAESISMDFNTPSPSGSFVSGTGSVTVATNDVMGYSVYITSSSATSTTLDHDTLSTAKINSITFTQTINTSNPTFANASTQNTWGWSNNGSTYYPVMTRGTRSTASYPTLYRRTNGPSSAGDTSTLTVGVTGNSTLVAGTYTGTLLLTAIVNSDDTTLVDYDQTLGN